MKQFVQTIILIFILLYFGLSAFADTDSLLEEQSFLKIELPGDIKCHTQGITEIDSFLFASCVQKLTKKAFVMKYELPENFPSSKSVFAKPEIIDVTEKGMHHPSGLDSDKSCVWNASAHYRQFMAKSKVMCIDPISLEQKSSFWVDDHIGTVGVIGDKLILMNWDSKNIYLYSKDGKQLGKHDNPTSIAYQDCSGSEENEVLCSGSISLDGVPTAVIDLLKFDERNNEFHHVNRVFLSTESQNLGREGFTGLGDFFIFLPGDYPAPTLYVFSEVKIKQPAIIK